MKGWVAQHKQGQKERERENKRYKRDFAEWTSPSIEDLTERDLYRFRVTSAIFKAVEKTGGKIESAPITGRVVFLVDGQKVECSIVEKTLKPLSRTEKDLAKWTAYPGPPSIWSAVLGLSSRRYDLSFEQTAPMDRNAREQDC